MILTILIFLNTGVGVRHCCAENAGESAEHVNEQFPERCVDFTQEIGTGTCDSKSVSTIVLKMF